MFCRLGDQEACYLAPEVFKHLKNKEDIVTEYD